MMITMVSEHKIRFFNCSHNWNLCENLRFGATVIQFPVILAHAITAHKIQGQTFVYPGRVAIEKIRAAPSALSKLKRLQQISFNRNPSPWHKEKVKAIQITFEDLCNTSEM